jgi:DnaJ-domain-containing protein 1
MKCEYPDCKMDAACKAPKSRTLKSYWNFCKKHAADYNQNWDFYKGMTQKEIERDWEKRTFGSEIDSNAERRNYRDIINDILSGKTSPNELYNRDNFPRDIMKAFETLGMKPARDMKKIRAAYLTLAKKHHPDSAKSKDAEKFKQISRAFQEISRFLKS